MKRIQFFKVMLITLVLSMACGLTSCTRCKNAWNALTAKQDTVDVPALKTIDVVAQRRAEIENRRVDSVYYAIQEPAFIAIIDLLGATATHQDVVMQYEKSTKFYQGINYGTKLHEHYAPDSVPKAPITVTSEPAIPQAKQ